MQLKTTSTYFLLFTFCFVLTSFHKKKINNLIDSKVLVDKLIEASNNIKTLRYSLKYSERLKGVLKNTNSSVKLQIAPRKIFINNAGAEILWVQGQNNGNALVNPGTFPYVNLNLDPYGTLMRKGGHHTLNESGFSFLVDIIKSAVKKTGDKFSKYFIVSGEEKFYGRDCYKLTIKYPEFAWEAYTVKKGETLVTIARKNCLSEHMILEKNAKISWYDDVKEGQVIQIPNVYSKLTVLLIDKEYMLPVSNNVYDDLGLYETYEYSDIKINSTITPEEFTKTYKDYHF